MRCCKRLQCVCPPYRYGGAKERIINGGLGETGGDHAHPGGRGCDGERLRPRAQPPRLCRRHHPGPVDTARRGQSRFGDEDAWSPLFRGGVRQERLVLCFRSEEHTSELQSLMRISYAVFCLKKKTKNHEST